MGREVRIDAAKHLYQSALADVRWLPGILKEGYPLAEAPFKCCEPINCEFHRTVPLLVLAQHTPDQIICEGSMC